MNKAESTRLHILEEAFALIYANGYRATSIDDILAQTKVTKGAFYYHFKNKDEMGIALIQELMYTHLHQGFLSPLKTHDDPLKAIYTMMKGLLINNPFFQVQYGCPAMNLIEEMAGTHPAFKKALGQIVAEWQKAVEQTVERGKKNNSIKHDVSPKQIALFISVGYSGIRNMGKLMGPGCYSSYLKTLKNYLESLRCS